MAKKWRERPIEMKDLEEFADKGTDDFLFELGVVRCLNERGFSAQHGGTYKDPVAGKFREFDVRASTTVRMGRAFFAIEAKNLRSNLPLVALTVPRPENEAKHAQFAKGREELVEHDNMRVASLYQPGHQVAKSLAQVGFDEGSKTTASNGDAFDRWSQALNSLQGVAREAADYSRSNEDRVGYLFPVLVVPDETLWTIPFDQAGRRAKPALTNRVSFSVMRIIKYPVRFTNERDPSVLVSHLEICTLSGLTQIVKSLGLAEDS
ncbi:MAG: hypothetical protein RIT81_09270 [Deltaproteobacteria bacterium]